MKIRIEYGSYLIRLNSRQLVDDEVPGTYIVSCESNPDPSWIGGQDF